MTDNLPPLPALPPHEVEEWSESCITLRGEGWKKETVEKYAVDYARAALAQAQSCVPAGYVLVPVELLKRAESSLGSFCSDHGWGDADMQAMDDISGLLAASPQPQPVQPTTEAAFLHSQIALALEEMSCANFNSAAERLRHITEVAQAKPEQAAQPNDMGNFFQPEKTT